MSAASSGGGSISSTNDEIITKLRQLESENNELKMKLKNTSLDNENINEEYETGNNNLAESSWDDTVILNVFNKAVKSHRVKKSNNEKRQRDSIVEDGELIGEPGPWQTVSTNDTENDSIRNSKKVCSNDEHLPKTLPGHGSQQYMLDEALNDMLAAWYHSGYMSGRYAAYSEMAAMNNNNL